MAAKPQRKKLEAVYTAYVQALRDKDADAFLAAAAVPEEMPAEALQGHLAEDSDMMLATSPELSQTEFVDIKTLGDELAGYYCTWAVPDSPKQVTIVLIPFQKTQAGWKVLLGGSVYGFEPEPGQDVQAKVRELIEAEPSLQLEPPEDAAAAMGDCDTDLSAVLECSAYDYEVTITVNGVQLDCSGGASHGLRLFGVAAGGEPGGLAVLRPGENRIDVTYRKTKADVPFPLEVKIFLQPAGECFRLVAGKRPSGSLGGTFEIPRSPTEDIRPDEIRLVEVTDDD